MRVVFVVILSLVLNFGVQGQLSFEVLAATPEPVSNNAVAGVEVDGKWFLYSFSGIDSTKEYTGIHAKVFRYDMEADSWSQLEDLPGNQPRIAAGASTINGKIYILGGYEVFSNGGEVSIDSLHVFDPVTNSYEEFALPIPKSIDDQVQLVYKDSLLYSVTGWSDFGNVRDVWIYDTYLKTWTEVTDIPSTNAFRGFGASGTIVGDTIYYLGGAVSVGNFPASDLLRKGYINPDNPAEITWSSEESDNAIFYRSGASSFAGKPFWLGGSLRTYNYDGIAYSDNTGVDATNRIIHYEPDNGGLYERYENFPEIMDLRGLVKISDNSFVSIGGMKEEQTVTDRVVKYTFEDLVDNKEFILEREILIKPTVNIGTFAVQVNTNRIGERFQIMDAQGRIVYQSSFKSSEEIIQLDLGNGIYFLNVDSNYTEFVTKKFVVVK